MRAWTWEEINEKVRNDTENLDKDFISDEEMLGYVNEAIDDAEALIHSIYEDYFLTFDNPTVLASATYIAMPDDIFANKIRLVQFDDGSLQYVMKRIKNLKEVAFITDSDEYGYLITNDPTLGYRMKLYPTARGALTGDITRWYLRNAARLTEDDDVCDIPEFINFIFQHMKVRCYEKEGNPTVVKAMDDLGQIKKLMVETLTGLTASEDDNFIEQDVSFYNDFDSGI